MNISDLLERAREKLGVKSDRALCRELRLVHQSYLRYRRGDGLPNDETMLRICAAAKVPDERGLLMLNMWRSTGQAATIYRRMLQRMGSETSAGGPMSAKSRTGPEQITA